MRILRAKEFLKVIKGEDIEFRIKPHAIHVKEPVVIDGIKSKCSLNFTSLKFDSIEISNSNFYGAYLQTDKQAKGQVVKPLLGLPPLVPFEKLKR